MNEPEPARHEDRSSPETSSRAPAATAASSESGLCFASAGAIARLIRTKQLSAREVLGVHLAQIERINPRVNAIVTLVPELAAAAAAAADELQARGEALGVLHGLPVAHKDLLDTRGIRTTYGSPLYRDHLPAEDDLVVARMRRAGAVTIGKTNTSEFGAGSQTFNTLFGATRNPYDPLRTCGGSSGGAAVAVACGMIPAATGTDMGGSLRNPAAFCNVVGFRASIGRVPDPRAAHPWSTLSTAGCIARSVADVALALSAIAGPDARAPLSIDEPGALFAGPLDRGFAGVRLAWFTDLGGVPFDPRVRTIVDAQRRTFEALGCVVEEAEPDFSPAEVAFRVLRAWHAAHTYGERLRANPEAFKATLRAEIEDGLRLTGGDVARAFSAHGEMWRRFQAFLEGYDYFILPTTQVPPFDVDVPYPTEIAGIGCDGYIDWMKSCWYVSTTGNPAASVPAGFTAEGLPVGLQIVGRHRADFSVLQLAHAYEAATGFGRRRPPVA